MKINLSITLFAKIKYEQLTITKVTILIKFKLDFLSILRKNLLKINSKEGALVMKT